MHRHAVRAAFDDSRRLLNNGHSTSLCTWVERAGSGTIEGVRYLVTARLKAESAQALATAIADGTLGRGSVAGDEYLRNMDAARELDDGRVQWVEVCYCPTPLLEERPYWEDYFLLDKVQDAHARSRCRDESGEEPWACGDCDCSAKLEARLETKGRPFLDCLGRRVDG